MPSEQVSEVEFLEEVQQAQEESNNLNQQRNNSIESFASMVQSVSALSLSMQVARSLESDEIPSIDDDASQDSVRASTLPRSSSWVNKFNSTNQRPSRAK